MTSTEHFNIWDFHGFARAMADRYDLLAQHVSAASEPGVNYGERAVCWCEAADRIEAEDVHGLYGLASVQDHVLGRVDADLMRAIALADTDSGVWHNQKGVRIGAFLISAKAAKP